MTTRARRLPVLLAIVFGITLLSAYYVFVGRPIWQASRIKDGDSIAVVRQLLGEPEVVFASTVELRNSYLGPMGYVFTDTADRQSDLDLDQLPEVQTRAEWYEYGYGVAGHLVYYDEAGVVNVYRGGT